MLVILPRLKCTLGPSPRIGYPLAIINPGLLPPLTLQGRFTSSDYWFNQMYYGTHGPFKRAQAGQAITFENDKVRTCRFFAQPRVSNIIPMKQISQVDEKTVHVVFESLIDTIICPVKQDII
jgi:hypothetical protein